MTGGPLYCRIRAFRIRAFDGAVGEYVAIYHREDGSERIAEDGRPTGRFLGEPAAYRVGPPGFL
jgi:hypothetical protein